MRSTQNFEKTAIFAEKNFEKTAIFYKINFEKTAILIIFALKIK